MVGAWVLSLLVLGSVSAQDQTVRQFVGTVTKFKPEAAEIEIKPDSAPPVAVRVVPDTEARRIAPGARDLKNAQVIQVTEVALGDRVLVALAPGSNDLRRLVVMSATDIAKRDEVDRVEWSKRGISGVVVVKSGNEITLKTRTTQGERQATVLIGAGTTFKRYSPDSVKFADAKPSGLAEIGIGDQLRARGDKSEDGLKVVAQAVVFGTFQTRAGTITSVDAESHTIRLKELATDKALTVRLTTDSQVKKMPDFSAMMQGRGGPPPGGPAGPAGRGGAPPDLMQMVDYWPPATLDELKPGQTIVVSSTKGAEKDSLTAIMLLANADLLIQMATAQPSGSGGRGQGANQGMNAAGANGMNGLGGFELPSMIP